MSGEGSERERERETETETERGREIESQAGSALTVGHDDLGLDPMSCEITT